MELLARIAFAFYLLIIAVGAVMAVGAKNLVRALVGLILTLFGVAGMYFLMAAPLVALMPLPMPPPSKAGPAEAEQHTIQSLLPIIISPFVPTSIRAFVSGWSGMPQAITPATISPPT